MNKGELNELMIVTYLNKKFYSELSEHWKENIKKMFPFVINEDQIFATIIENRHCKPDIEIMIRQTRIKVSIKSGHNPSIHQEFFFCFMAFLKENDVSRRTLRIIEFYHFGKTKKLSNNGRPFTREEIIKNFGNYLNEANKEINNIDLIKKIVYRCVIKGAKAYYKKLDFFYYGNVDKGFLYSEKEIFETVIREKKDDNKAIHFGGLVYQPCGRKEDRVDKNYSRIKWPILCVKFYDNDII